MKVELLGEMIDIPDHELEKAKQRIDKASLLLEPVLHCDIAFGLAKKLRYHDLSRVYLVPKSQMSRGFVPLIYELAFLVLHRRYRNRVKVIEYQPELESEIHKLMVILRDLILYIRYRRKLLEFLQSKGVEVKSQEHFNLLVLVTLIDEYNSLKPEDINIEELRNWFKAWKLDFKANKNLRKKLVIKISEEGET